MPTPQENQILTAFVDLIKTVVHVSLEDFATEAGIQIGSFDQAGAAKYLDVSKSTIHRLTKDGELKSVTIRGMRRWTRSALDRYLTKLEKRKG